MNAVPPGAGARQEQHVAGSVRRRAGQVVDAGDADAHCIDQRVLGVGFVEVDFAGYVGDADAIAVPSDAVHHATQQAAVGGFVGRPEAQRVEQGDGSRPHGQDVPHNAADAGSRALQWLHRRRMVVGFHLEYHRQPVSDVNRPGVFRAGLGQGALRRRRQHPQQRARVLVAAMLAPQRAEHPQLNRVGLPVQPLHDHLVFGGRQRDFVQYFFANRHCGPQ